MICANAWMRVGAGAETRMVELHPVRFLLVDIAQGYAQDDRGIAAEGHLQVLALAGTDVSCRQLIAWLRIVGCQRLATHTMALSK